MLGLASMTIPHPETTQGPTWFTQTQVWAEKPGMNHTDNPIIWEILRGSGTGVQGQPDFYYTTESLQK